jgi:hypothetical protein
MFDIFQRLDPKGARCPQKPVVIEMFVTTTPLGSIVRRSTPGGSTTSTRENSSMIRTRTHLLRGITILGAMAISVTGCGKVVEKATEQAVEEAVESESGENVDIDFSDDGLSVESEDGDLSVSVDEDGGVQIDGSDAEGNDFSVDGDDDGSFTVTDENGEVVTGDIDADGDTVEFSAETEDGDTSFSTSGGIPEEWPSDVPQPEGLSDIAGSTTQVGGDTSVSLTGTSTGEMKAYIDSYVSTLTAAGFEGQSLPSDEAGVYGSYTRGDTNVIVTAEQKDDDLFQVFISVL